MVLGKESKINLIHIKLHQEKKTAFDYKVIKAFNIF